MARGRVRLSLLTLVVASWASNDNDDKSTTAATLRPSLDSSSLWTELASDPSSSSTDANRVCSDGPLRELVLEGGGVKGIAYSGAACALEDAGLLGEIRSLSGSSAGAIAAALLASGYGCDEMRRYLWELDLNSLVTSKGGFLGSLERLRSTYGLYDGAMLEASVEKLLAQRTGIDNITFAQLAALSPTGTGKRLRLTATSLSTSRLVIFDAAATPDVPISRAVRASSSLPVLFTPTKIMLDNTEHTFVDGGLLRNLPVQTDTTGASDQPRSGIMALGLRTQRLLGQANPHPLRSFTDFLSRVYWTAIWGPDSSNSLLTFWSNPQVEYVPIDLTDVHVSPHDFDLVRAQKQQIERAGWLAVTRQLLRCGRTKWPDSGGGD